MSPSFVFTWFLVATGLVKGISCKNSTEAPEASCNGTGLEYITHEKKLMTCLLRDYDPTVRPASSPKEAVHIVLDSVVLTVNSLNEKTGVLVTESWLKQSWKDVQLNWNPLQYGGLEDIRIPAEKLWTPEIVLLNNADESFRYVMDKLAVVNSVGHVTWAPHARLRSFCDLDLTYFPYDTQLCHMLLGSLTYDTSLVNITLSPTGNRRFLPKTSDWEVEDFEVGVIRITDGFKNYPTVTYSVQLKRISIFYRYVLVAPSVVLACLTLVLFWIPAESSERLTLATGILVSLSVLLVLLEGYLPTELGKLPIIASYLGFNLILLVITIIISVMAMNFHYRGVQGGAVPSWIRWIFLGRLSRLMCVKVRPYAESVMNFEEITRDFRELLPNTEPDRATDTMDKTLHDIRQYLHILATTRNPDITVSGHHVTPHSKLVMNEWQQLSLVLDRLMFFIFLSISLITTIVIYGHS